MKGAWKEIERSVAEDLKERGRKLKGARKEIERSAKAD